MSYGASLDLQTALYRLLCDDPAVGALVGDAVYDAVPVAAPAGIYIALGPEEVRDASDATAAGSRHDLVISVLSGRDDQEGFSGVKEVAAAVSQAVEGGDLALTQGQLVGIWFLRATARRVENGAGRRIDLTYRARIDLE